MKAGSRCRWRETPFVDERLPEGQGLRIIDAEHPNRYPTNRRAADQERPRPPKAALPRVPSGVEQLDELVGLRVSTGDIGPLETVAVKARQAQVFRPRDLCSLRTGRARCTSAPPCFLAMMWSISKVSSESACASWQYSHRPPARCQTSSTSSCSIGPLSVRAVSGSGGPWSASGPRSSRCAGSCRVLLPRPSRDFLPGP